MTRAYRTYVRVYSSRVEKEVNDMPKGRSLGTRKVSRSAISGRFVKGSTAKRSPKTTVTETVKTSKGKKG